VDDVDDNELYPIGDVARRTGLSVSAIRFYADAEVIAPTDVTDAGYRLYDVQAIARLELVRTLRELGAGLEDIRRLLADETTLRDLATAHLALVERQTRRLQARRAVLRTIVTGESHAQARLHVRRRP
jgi:DNA-binding transcriptional MerR regulator